MQVIPFNCYSENCYVQDFYVNQHNFCNYTAMRVCWGVSTSSFMSNIYSKYFFNCPYVFDRGNRQYIEDISTDGVPGMTQREELGANCWESYKSDPGNNMTEFFFSLSLWESHQLFSSPWQLLLLLQRLQHMVYPRLDIITLLHTHAHTHKHTKHTLPHASRGLVSIQPSRETTLIVFSLLFFLTVFEPAPFTRPVFDIRCCFSVSVHLFYVTIVYYR